MVSSGLLTPIPPTQDAAAYRATKAALLDALDLPYTAALRDTGVR